MNLDLLPPTITVEHAGELLGLSRSAAYRAADRGELPTIRFGRRLFVPTPKLLALLGGARDDPRDEARERRPPAEVIDEPKLDEPLRRSRTLPRRRARHPSTPQGRRDRRSRRARPHMVIGHGRWVSLARRGGLMDLRPTDRSLEARVGARSQ